MDFGREGGCGPRGEAAEEEAAAIRVWSFGCRHVSPVIERFFIARGTILGCPMGLGTPPSSGYFGRKILAFNGLQRVIACKILIVNGLWLKYSLSMS